MLFRFRSPATCRDLELSTAHPAATVDDLAAALQPDGPVPRGLWVDGRRVRPSTPLDRAGIANGCTVSLEPVPVTSGNRSPDATGRGPTSIRNRTGRRAPAPPPEPVLLPDPEPSAATVTSIGVVAVAASVLGAGVMVAVLGSWTYAAFAVIGPVMMVAASLDGRVRRRRSRRRYARYVRREVGRLGVDLTAAASVERLRRRAWYPGPAAALAVIHAEPPECWERRPDHPDAWCVRVGHGSAPWEPPITGELDRAADEVRTTVDAHRTLPDVALGLDLRAAATVAVVGDPDRARSLARAVLVQLVAGHGPADLVVAAVVDPARATSWDWLAWLPQAVDRNGRRTSAVRGPAADDLAARLTDGLAGDADPSDPAGQPLLLVLVDDAEALTARRSAARSLVRLAADPHRPVSCLVVLGPHDPVPATCTTVLRVGDDGTLDAPHPVAAGPARACALGEEETAAAARALSRFEDPDVDLLGGQGRTLPGEVRLTTLLDLDPHDAASIARRWQTCGRDPAPVALLGTAADGPLALDLAADGPHVLVAGTTGAGKSEALRTLVVSLAAANSPDHLVFVLIDFKGGSAFDACTRLPHTVGLVTDLDDHLAARALRCLEAELRHREARLRASGAADLAAHRATSANHEPLPRLVVVIDEFATLAATLPTFLDALVDVAQRGRSLGVHLVLATQRPGGAVSPSIQANVGVRIALRVQSAAESVDVIDAPAAAHLPRQVPGRALVRFGPGDLVPVQVACASLPAVDTLPRVALQPLGIPRLATGTTRAIDVDHPTDLAVVAAALDAAWQTLDRPAPRRPWPEPLPEHLHWPPPRPDGAPDDVDEPPDAVALGHADDPDHQRTTAFTWRVGAGPLLGVGLPGSGTRSLAITAALAVAERWAASDCHVHVIDGAGSALVPLAGLPHVGAVVTAGEVERQRRLLQDLAAELSRRRAGGRPTVRRVLVLHAVTGLQARWEEAGHLDAWPQVLDLVTDGSALGIHVCVTAEAASVPHRLVAACEQRVIFRLGDPADHAAFGVAPREVPDLPPGRGLAPRSAARAALVQVAHPLDGVAAAVARLAAKGDPPSPSAPTWIGTLPDRLDRDALADHTPPAPPPKRDGSLVLPIGLADRDLGVATVDLAPGGHALVAGPPRSGRTTALATLAHAVAEAAPGVALVVVATGPRPDGAPWGWPPSATLVSPRDDHLATLVDHPGPLVVLVDDADLLADDHPHLARLAVERRPDRHVVATGRNDRLRARYGHWTRELRAEGTGLLLMPDLDLDGDLLGARLPRRAPVASSPGRGWLTGPGVGAHGFVQVALPTASGP